MVSGGGEVEEESPSAASESERRPQKERERVGEENLSKRCQGTAGSFTSESEGCGPGGSKRGEAFYCSERARV